MGTVIKLYQCSRCGWIMDEADTMSAVPCSRCDAKMMKMAAPTKWNVFKYFIGHPKMLKLWVKENVFKRNR